jgi:GNAT superfamily N-acetyltransferase
MINIRIREAGPDDAGPVGGLHAMSWKSAYRGILPDSYLDHNLEGERKKYWAEKLAALSSKEFVLVADTGKEIIGFAALMDKPEKGYDALIDNLHVHPDVKGQGVGGQLMKAVIDRLLETGRKSFYLWVLKGNIAAEAFYKAKGGKPADSGTVLFGGTLVGETRFVWEDIGKNMKFT